MTSADTPLTDPEAALKTVFTLAETCGYDAAHALQVTRLALQLFDATRKLHKLGEMDKFWLQAAGILHDIGWLEGQKSHHKTALRIILTTPLLQFSNKERLIIGSIARYHRRALPDLSHDHFAALNYEEQQNVLPLSALLRLADGMDYTHQERVIDLECRTSKEKIQVACLLNSPAPEEMIGARKKSDLMELVFQRKVKLSWRLDE